MSANLQSSFVGKFILREVFFVGKSGLPTPPIISLASPLVLAIMMAGDDYDDAITIMMIDHDYNNKNDDDAAYNDDSDDNNGN